MPIEAEFRAAAGQSGSGCPDGAAYQGKAPAMPAEGAPVVRPRASRPAGSEHRAGTQQRCLPSSRADCTRDSASAPSAHKLANLHIDLAVGTRLLRTQPTSDIALKRRTSTTTDRTRLRRTQDRRSRGRADRGLPVLEEVSTPRTTASPTAKASKAPRRYANALRRLLARTETVTLVVVHELSLRYILAAAATGSSPVPGTVFPNAVP